MNGDTSIRWDRLLRNLSREYPEVDLQRLDVRQVGALRTRYPASFPDGMQVGDLRAFQVPQDPDGAWMVEARSPRLATGRKPVFLRDIAHPLERHLNSLEGCSIHWVGVVGEDSITPAPTRRWLYDDHLLQFSFTEGNSEGMLIYVHAQADRYKPADLIPLLRLKMLCGRAGIHDELRRVHTWFESEAFASIVSQPATIPA